MPKYTINSAKATEIAALKKLSELPSTMRMLRQAEGAAQIASTMKMKPITSFQSACIGRMIPGSTCPRNRFTSPALFLRLAIR